MNTSRPVESARMKLAKLWANQNISVTLGGKSLQAKTEVTLASKVSDLIPYHTLLNTQFLSLSVNALHGYKVINNVADSKLFPELFTFPRVKPIHNPAE
jgi:hypothetical protein